MLIKDLQTVLSNNKTKNPLYVRSVLKETVQYYILDFISKSAWSDNFLFKGGTCLRICFGLPRLSEDLDFDILNYQDFELKHFLKDLKNYFNKDLKISKLSIKIAGNQKIIYLKFPILKDLGIAGKNESNILFVRLDLSPTVGKTYKSKISIKSAPGFSFLIKRYSLKDLFSGKLAAILTRETLEGKAKKARFKGRDFFDLIWFLEKKVQPNWDYLAELTRLSKKEAIEKLENKVKNVRPEFLKTDLLPFFQDSQFVINFAKNFKSLFENYKSSLE